MPKPRKPNKPKPGPTSGGSKTPAGGRQVNFRANDELFERLDQTATGLGLDVSNFVRMVLLENLPTYERRVEQIRRGPPPEPKESGEG